MIPNNNVLNYTTMRSIKLILPFLLLLLSFYKSGAQTTGQERPNVIFFIADDMTRDMFNFLPESKGENLTPNLDKLSKKGTILMGQHVSSTVCTPSRYSVLTGKYASRAHNPGFLRQTKKNDGQRVVEWNTHILPSDTSLAKILKHNGYRTGAVGKNHVIEVKGWEDIPLSADTANDRVMEQQRENYRLTVEAFKKTGFEYADGIFYENPDFNGPRALAVHNLDWTTEAALEFLQQQDDRPFFLYFATTLPHGPKEADRSWNADRRITPIGVLEEAPDVLPDKSIIQERLNEAGIKVNNDNANLLWLDDALGALIKGLKEEGLYDNTIIFFFNDHGQFAKGTVYQGATCNPSIVWKSDGFKVGHETDALLSNVDFTPTILDFANVDFTNCSFDGESFVDVLEAEEFEGRESLYFEIGYSRGIRKGRYKYIALRYPDWVKELTLKDRKRILAAYNKKLKLRGRKPNNTDPTAPFGHVQIIPGGGDAEFFATQRYPNYAERDQLYDLEKDPHEKTNLADDPEYRKVLKQLKAELSDYIESLPGKFGEFD